MISTERTSTRPILLLGGAHSGARACIRDVLIAAGYTVVTASDADEGLLAAALHHPRVVAVAVEGEGQDDREHLLYPLAEIGRAAPVVLVEGGAPRCRAPSFARQILEEIQYVERPHFTRRAAATR